MTATKPLDLAAFERSHAKEIEIDADAGALPIAQFRHIRASEQYAAILAECKRQREQIAKLRAALAGLTGLAKMRGGHLHEYAAAVCTADKILDKTR